MFKAPRGLMQERSMQRETSKPNDCDWPVCGCTDHGKPCRPTPAQAIELAYGLLWMVGCDRSRPNGAALYEARKALMGQLDRDGQSRGITAARAIAHPLVGRPEALADEIPPLPVPPADAVGASQSVEAIALDMQAPAPCADLSVQELIEWLSQPQYTNGFLDFDAAKHMESAATLIERLLAGHPASEREASHAAEEVRDHILGLVANWLGNPNPDRACVAAVLDAQIRDMQMPALPAASPGTSREALLQRTLEATKADFEAMMMGFHLPASEAILARIDAALAQPATVGEK